jgi:hypothetical protein
MIMAYRRPRSLAPRPPMATTSGGRRFGTIWAQTTTPRTEAVRFFVEYWAVRGPHQLSLTSTSSGTTMFWTPSATRSYDWLVPSLYGNG